jgi:GrpB-like predicted nucleotidyltransferase (UPF0157 family)/8-oxo-dGTP pyrophosphatase MutT (NUDIX family)
MPIDILQVAEAGRWQAAFVQERSLIEAALGPLEIEHVGSTSLADMPAKPILDIQINVPDFDLARPYIEPLQGLGYTYRGEYGIARRHYFVKGEPRTHHLHMLEAGSHDAVAITLFRDYLRANAAAAAHYAAQKQSIAATVATREQYQAAKDEVVAGLLEQAIAAASPVDKVLAYVTRGSELLILIEPDYPESGTQVPGGTMEPGEIPEEAVLREAFEETGIGDLRIVRQLGTRLYAPAKGPLQRHYFYHLTTPSPLPDTWEHWEMMASDNPDPVLFRFRWTPVDNVPKLHAGRGAQLDALCAPLRVVSDVPDVTDMSVPDSSERRTP